MNKQFPKLMQSNKDMVIILAIKLIDDAYLGECISGIVVGLGNSSRYHIGYHAADFAPSCFIDCIM